MYDAYSPLTTSEPHIIDKGASLPSLQEPSSPKNTLLGGWHDGPSHGSNNVPVNSTPENQSPTTTPTQIAHSSASSSDVIIVDGTPFNTKGYEVCGHLNQHSKPCQRIGKCPFHASKKFNTSTKKVFPPVKKTPYKQGWSKDEHIRFLNGLQVHGRGAWKEIAGIVGSRTPTQIQSHAQKYYLRQKQEKKDKRSIHDLSLEDLQDLNVSSYAINHCGYPTMMINSGNPQAQYPPIQSISSLGMNPNPSVVSPVSPSMGIHTISSLNMNNSNEIMNNIMFSHQNMSSMNIGSTNSLSSPAYASLGYQPWFPAHPHLHHISPFNMTLSGNTNGEEADADSFSNGSVRQDEPNLQDVDEGAHPQWKVNKVGGIEIEKEHGSRRRIFAGDHGTGYSFEDGRLSKQMKLHHHREDVVQNEEFTQDYLRLQQDMQPRE